MATPIGRSGRLENHWARSQSCCDQGLIRGGGGGGGAIGVDWVSSHPPMGLIVDTTLNKGQ